MEYDYLPILARIKSEKEASNLTNSQLSALSGISVGTLNKILSGETTTPQLPAVMAIASALGVSVDYLIYGHEKNPPPDKPGSGFHDQLDAMIDALSQDEAKAILEFVEFLLWKREQQ